MNLQIGNYTMKVNMSRIAVLLGVMLWGMAVVLPAQTGSSSANFLRVEPDARSGGMAGVGATLLDGGYAGYYNPAILGWQRGTSAGFSYSNWLAGLSRDYRYNHVAGGFELSNRSSLSGNITYFNLGEQMATDENNVQLGRFSSYQMAAGLSYGRLLGTHFSWGLGGKFIYSSLGSGQMVDGLQIEPAASGALDFGVLYRSGVWQVAGIPSEVRLGAGVSNIGPGLRYLEGQSRGALPQTFRGGVGVELNPGRTGMHMITVSADITRLLSRMEQTVSAGDTTWSSMSPLRSLLSGWGSVERFNGQEMVSLSSFEQFGLGTGVEYWYNNLFALRGGYYLEHRDNGGRRFATVGTGLRYGSAEVDFSYLIATQHDHPLDGTLRFSLKLHFSSGGYQAPRMVATRQSKPTEWYAPVVDSPPVLQDSVFYEQPVVVEQPVALAPIVVEPVVETSNVAALELIASINVDLSGFATMSSELSQVQKDAIARAVILLQRDRSITVNVSGHTDNRGSKALNDMLSEARARAIYLEMLSYGVLDWSRVSIEGFGDTQPKEDAPGALARQVNRRGELSIPATDQSLLWILEEPTGALEKLSVEGAKPVNAGTEFVFTWLQINQSNESQRWVHSLAAHLLQHPNNTVKVANVVNYASGGRAFTRELGKARSELLKDLLIRLGVAPSQIEVINEQSPYWKMYTTDLPSENNTEKTWFFLSDW
jgi:outer membrane protein OmpA-like peptidoglycan-associated protein